MQITQIICHVPNLTKILESAPVIVRIPLEMIRPSNCIFAASTKTKSDMDRKNMESLSKEEMESVKGGAWVIIDGEWYWVEGLPREEEDI